MAEGTKNARSAIINAFNRLILSRRILKPRVADILDEAGVARSTFYEHFDGRDSLLLNAMRAPLSAVADAACGTGDQESLAAVLDHFRENKRAAVELLTGPLAPRVVRTLADMIDERLGETPAGRAAARHLADLQIGFIRLWLTGETPYAARELAALMIRSVAAQKDVLAQ